MHTSGRIPEAGVATSRDRGCRQYLAAFYIFAIPSDLKDLIGEKRFYDRREQIINTHSSAADIAKVRLIKYFIRPWSTL